MASSASNSTGSPQTAESADNDRIPTGLTIPDPHSVEEFGRTFHGYREGKYLLPNDGDEQDRLDMQHHIWFLSLDGKLACAPIESPKNVLDVGTGTGIWAIKFAESHPDAKVYGTDLSLIQPDNAPSNCSFAREDSEEDWVFDVPFDYIHMRMMCTCFDNPHAMVNKCFDQLAPGGWLEYQESSFEVIGSDKTSDARVEASPFKKWIQLLVDGMKNMLGRDIQSALKYKAWLEEVGFVNVVEKQILMPMNGWPLDPKDKLIGNFSALDMYKAVEGLSLKMLQGSGMSVEEIRNFIPKVQECVKDTSLRAYYPAYIVYGQKPGGAETKAESETPQITDDAHLAKEVDSPADDQPTKRARMKEDSPPLPESARTKSKASIWTSVKTQIDSSLSSTGQMPPKLEVDDNESDSPGESR